MTPKQFTENARAKQGIKADTLKARIKADSVWAQIVRGKFQSSLQFSDKDVAVRAAGQEPTRTQTRSATTTACARSCSWCRAARRRRPSRRAEGSRGAARALPELRRGHRARPRHCATSRCARSIKGIRRSAGSAARHPRQDRDRPADRAGDRRSRASRCLRCAARRAVRATRRRKREVRDEMFNERVRGAVQEVPQGTAQPGADRVQVGSGDDATAGADARRAGRHRPRHHARGLARRAD